MSKPKKVKARWAKLVGLPLVLLTSAATACIVVNDGAPSFDLNIGGTFVSSVADDMGERLEAAFGTRWGRGHSVAGVVRYQVKTIFGMGIGTYAIPFDKPCGQNFKERARAIYLGEHAGTGGVGLVCDVPGSSASWGVIGYSPVYGNPQTCTPTGCQSEGTMLLGYEPIYGMTTTDISLLDC